MSKIIDETGNTYTYLKVLEKANSIGGRAAWKCQCRCGKEIIVKGVYLRNGKVKSCGCYQKEQTSKACSKDLIGQTIGNFTVLESIQGEKNGERHKWRCRCNLCGNENVYISTSNLTQQYSCGCAMSSKGERKIKEILTELEINFIQEKRFSDCVFESNKMARFDFYLPNENIIIEYDGRQHYQGPDTLVWSSYQSQTKQEALEEIHFRDALKNKYCQENNFILKRIPYWISLKQLTIEDIYSDKYNVK